MGSFDGLFHDFRHALRTLRRDTSFTITALLILTVGIGAKAAVFSIVNSVLLRPLAYHAPDRLFGVEEVIPQWSHIHPVLPVNARHFMEWKRRCSAFEDAALVNRAEFNLTAAGDPEWLTGARVTANFFSVLGVRIRMALGAGQRHVLTMVLGQGLWPVALGLGAGIGGALALGRLVSSLLFSVSPTDATTFGVVAVVTVAAAFFACWIPARRAACIDPLQALRYE